MINAVWNPVASGRAAGSLVAVLLVSSLAAQTPTPPSPATPSQAAAKPPAPARVPPTFHKIAAGDLDGDGKDEVVIYDSDSRALRVLGYSNGRQTERAAHVIERFPHLMRIADVDGDGKKELLIGEGLRGYNPKDGPQTDVYLMAYHPLDPDGWNPVQLFRHATERPEVTSLEVADVDGDGRIDVLLTYFESKYISSTRVLHHHAGSWSADSLPSIRMGMHVAPLRRARSGPASLIVGRPYGDSIGAIGDAFVVAGGKREALPVYRGVSSVAVGDVDRDGSPDIVIGDGWHSDFGKIARARIAVMTHKGQKWDYALIEDLPGHTRFESIELADLDGDRSPEIVAYAARASSLGGEVRIYQRTRSGAWRGTTAMESVQDFAVADVDGTGKHELVFAGAPLPRLALAPASIKWDAELGPAVLTSEVDPKSLVGKSAPELQVARWIAAGGSTTARADARSLATLRGKVVLLDFWATWCKPCIELIPRLKSWQSAYGSQGLVILGVTNHSSQDDAAINAFAARQKLPWALAVDPGSRPHLAYGVSPIPHTVLIDRTGKVRLVHVGGGAMEGVEQELRALLAEQGATASTP